MHEDTSISGTSEGAMSRAKPIVAIDGPSGSGKSTVSKLVAQQLGFVYLDTGAMYRCVGLLALRRRVDPLNEDEFQTLLDKLTISFARDQQGGQQVLVNGEQVTRAIRGHEVSQAASKVSSLPVVRARLVAMQRAMGAGGGVVMEGRDIGTNVFPDAEVKVFLTASAQVRARRRYEELKARGEDVEYGVVLTDQLERDERDSRRELNPLDLAPDAHLLDTSNLTIDQVVAQIVAWARQG